MQTPTLVAREPLEEVGHVSDQVGRGLLPVVDRLDADRDAALAGVRAELGDDTAGLARTRA